MWECCAQSQGFGIFAPRRGNEGRGVILFRRAKGGGGRYTNICTPKIGVAEICAPQSCGNELVHDSKSQQIRTTIVPESRTHVLEEALDL